MSYKNPKEYTTLSVRKESLEKLQKKKVHKRQSNAEVFEEILEEVVGGE